MQLKYINYSKIKKKKKFQNIYLSSFDKDERFPLWVLRLCAKEKNVEFNGIFDNEELIGLEYIVNCEDFTYLMYLAEEKNKRKKEKKELLTPEKKDVLRSKGLQPPRGILLVGVPGCGKSLSAKSISANGVNVVTVVPAASAEAAATNRQTNVIKPEILLRIA